MHRRRRGYGRGGLRQAFNSLFEMLTAVIATVALVVIFANTFNSLFEMQLFSQPTHNMSTKLITFNSLFEMPRCTSQPRLRTTSRNAFNSLFEMQSLKITPKRSDVLKLFQFSI